MRVQLLVVEKPDSLENQEKKLMFYLPDFSPIRRVDNPSFDTDNHEHQNEADLK